ncbi:MAG: hypothetical protein NC131_00505 [Roseburia sp.]|nr:hypothetical protein [Roseburia sp.]
MTKEKKEKIKNYAIRISLIVGLVFLILLAVASLVGIILSLCGIGRDLLSIFASVFATSIGSVLTIGALLLTLKHNNELIALQKAELERTCLNSINQIRNSLTLEQIEINKSLLPKNPTHTNPNIKTGKQNFRVGLIFSAKNINELSGAVIKRFALYFNQKLSNGEQLKFVLCGKFNEFKPISNKGENTFLYEIITNITDKNYNDIIRTLDNVPNCGLTVDMRFIIKSNDGTICAWKKRNHNRVRLQLNNFDSKGQIYIFNKI